MASLDRLLWPYSDESYRRQYCWRCQQVILIFDQFLAKSSQQSDFNFTNRRKIKLGTLGSLRKRKSCRVCQIISNLLTQFNEGLDDNESVSFDSQEGDMQIHAGSIYSHYRDLSLYHSSHSHIRKFRSNEVQIGRIYNPQAIDLQLVRRWIDSCERSHMSCCNIPAKVQLLDKVLLIDVLQECLVSLPLSTRFIALSYVWGQCSVTKTTQGNLPFLRTPGSISADSGIIIPTTIRDALCLVKKLGERFLWVDCLCIVQDDDAVKQLHLKSMTSIYSHAWLTIVAADGKDANWGIRGIGDDAKCRNVAWNGFPINVHQHIIVNATRLFYPTDSPWADRAWTYQEEQFSRRCLIFNGLVSWICNEARWEEHIKKLSEDNISTHHDELRAIRPNIPADDLICPDLVNWAVAVNEFNSRKLTYDKDVLDAFAGIEQFYAPGFGGRMLWGIPEMFFDICILWEPQSPLRRRGKQSPVHGVTNLPSWSWVGWEGKLVMVGHYSPPCYEPEYDDEIIEIRPLFETFVTFRSENSSVLQKSPIKNIWYDLQRRYKNNKSGPVPQDWIREAYPAPYQDQTQYKHPKLAAGKNLRYPVPLNDEISPTFHFDPVLQFRTKRAWLYVWEMLEEKWAAWTTCPMTLVDEQGEWAGLLCLNCSRFEPAPTGQRCELIALSVGRAKERVDNERGIADCIEEWYFPLRPKDSEFYEFYNVMYIEWEAGIAYRRAIGRVYKPKWEGLKLEEVDVSLG